MFQGQKRTWYKELAQVVELLAANGYDRYVDLFGGSGFCSRLIKDVHPGATVVYNDFDNYSERLKHVEETNIILQFLRDITKDVERNKPLPDEMHYPIMKYLYESERKFGYVDTITISGNLLFSGRFVRSLKEIDRENFWCKAVKENYDAEACHAYLEGLNVISVDAFRLLPLITPGTVCIVDPPYMGTDCKRYSGNIGLSKHLELIFKLIKSECLVVYFTSDKSELFMVFETMNKALFDGCFDYKIFSHKVGINYNAQYVDYMIVFGAGKLLKKIKL